jgi:hypothetical protein
LFLQRSYIALGDTVPVTGSWAVEITKQWLLGLSEKNDVENKESRQKEETILSSIASIDLPGEGITLDILQRIADWKAARTKGYIERNNPNYVKEVTRASFASTNERFKLEVLTLLNGVRFRMATAILMFCYPNKYTVMDWRAWASLENIGILNRGIKDTYEHYLEYNETCKKLAMEHGVSLRTLDKALWQWKGGE